MSRTIQQLAQEALDVQDACNLLAVVNGMSRAIKELREICAGWHTVDSHPIVMLWADKIASLTETQTLGDERVSRAFHAVYAIVEGRTCHAEAVGNL